MPIETRPHRHLVVRLVFLVALCALARTGAAQVGSGWNEIGYSKCAHYGGSWGGHYSSSGGVETFWISGTEQRAEIMLCSPKWTSGRYQFQGEVNTRSGSGGTGGSSVQQVFGIAGRNSDAFQLRAVTADGGTYRTQTDNNPAAVVATGIYGVFTRVNVIHDANANRLYVFINGSQRWSGVDGGDSTHYFKYGIYLRAETNPQAQWRGIRLFSGGTPGGGGTPTPTPTPTPTTPSLTPTPTPTPSGGFIEITPPASAVTASTHDGNLPGNTVDNNLSTRWSANGDGQWVRYDLGFAQAVTHVGVAVYNGNSRRNQFELQVSNDGVAWETVWSGQSSGTTTQQEMYDVADRTARWVRYLGHAADTSTFNSVTEVSLFQTGGSPTPTPVPTFTPTPTPVSTMPVDVTPGAGGVSASADDGNVPGNTVDDSLSTRWSANGDGQWIQYDLGVTRTVAYLQAAWYQGNTRVSTFDAAVSDSPTGPWAAVLTGRQSSGTTTGIETYDFTDAPGRYVRITGHGNSASTWNSISEVNVFAVP
jgi:hypothetical protein